jgi:hypothetical protein
MQRGRFVVVSIGVELLFLLGDDADETANEFVALD